MSSQSDHRKSVDASSESVCDALLALIDRVDDRECKTLPSLYQTIDPDAVDERFTPRVGGADRSVGCTVAFQYADYEIRIASVEGRNTAIELATER